MIRLLDDGHIRIQGGTRCHSSTAVPWKNKSKAIEEFVERKYLRNGGTHREAITFGAIDDATGYVLLLEMAL
jgi:hypothetical protein